MALSMLDAAYAILKEEKKPVKFQDLFLKVADMLHLSDKEKLAKVSLFYTNLTTDGRFVILSDNFWDLRERVTYSQAHVEVETLDDIADEEGDEGEGEESDEGDEDEEGKEGFDDADDDADRKAELANSELNY